MNRLRPGDRLELFCPTCWRATAHRYEGKRLYTCMWCGESRRRVRLAS